MVTKKVSKDRYFFFFSRRIKVVLAKVAWRSLWTQRWVTFAPEGVWGSASGDLRSPPCGGISDPRPASRHIRSEKEKHAVSSGVLRLFAWTTDDGETCVWGGACWGQYGARCEREVRQRDGGDEAPWQRVSSVKVYTQCCDTAMFLMYRSKNRSQVSECFSNIVFFVKHPGYSKVCLSDAAAEDCSANISWSYWRFWKILRFSKKLLCTSVVSFTDTLSVCIVKKKKSLD